MKIINEVFIGSLSGKTEEEQKEIIEKFRENNRHDKIKISISPKEVNKELLKKLKSYNVSTIELEVQSTNRIHTKKMWIYI